jgi:hypothetical protein
VGHTYVPCEAYLAKLALGVKEKATESATAPFLPPHCNRRSDSGAHGAQIFPAYWDSGRRNQNFDHFAKVTKDRTHGSPLPPLGAAETTW